MSVFDSPCLVSCQSSHLISIIIEQAVETLLCTCTSSCSFLSESTSFETEAAYVNVLTRGDLSSLRWIESPLKYFDKADNLTKELCTVAYTALNFRDIMLATGKLPPDAIPGSVIVDDETIG